MPALGAHELLHDRYQVLRRIGRGGMGTVYEAVDLRLRNIVAVKQMHALGSEADQAFEREATLLAALRHQALPVVIDAFSDDESRFFVMQYIEGEDLEARMRRTGPCTESDATRWAVAVLNALAYLHGHRPPIVHRDIKPSNIKLTPRGDVVLLDFGLAKGRPDPQATSRGEEVSIYGFTPNYAPLEQLEARGTDPRSDLYALGATLYHLVFGVAPPTAGDRAAAVVSGRSDPLTATWPTSAISHGFRSALTTALELDRERRFQSAHEMLGALTCGAPSEAVAPPALRETGARRIDAAAPSQAEVGRPLDVIAQVRFADSPRLGLEDWPSRRRPAQIEQASEHVRVEHREDPRTGRKLPARLRVALVAPDFEIRGATEYVIDVPPDEYSKRLVFLLTPRRAGYCRVHVEVYTAVESVLLGTVPVETEAVTTPVQFSPVRATELVLGVMAAPVPQVMYGDASPMPSARQRPIHEARQEAERRTRFDREEAEQERASEEAKRRRAVEEREARELEARAHEERKREEHARSRREAAEYERRAFEARKALESADQEKAARERAAQEERARRQRESEAPDVAVGSPLATPAASATPPATGPAAPVRRSQRDTAAPSKPPSDATRVQRDELPASPAPAPGGGVRSGTPQHWSLPRWAYTAAMLAVVLTSVVVWRTAQVGDAPTLAPPPTDAPPPTSATPPADPGPAPEPTTPVLPPSMSAPPPGPDETPVTDFDQPPRVIASPAPNVPVGASGVVVVEVIVRTDGTVSRVRLLTETPYAAQVIEAAERWRFEPALRRGRPVTASHRIQLDLSSAK